MKHVTMQVESDYGTRLLFINVNALIYMYYSFTSLQVHYGLNFVLIFDVLFM